MTQINPKDLQIGKLYAQFANSGEASGRLKYFKIVQVLSLPTTLSGHSENFKNRTSYECNLLYGMTTKRVMISNGIILRHMRGYIKHPHIDHQTHTFSDSAMMFELSDDEINNIVIENL